MLKVCRNPSSIARVQTWDGKASVPVGVEKVLGDIWPKETGCVAGRSADVIAVGPTDWLVLVGDPTALSVLSALEREFENSAFRVTHVSQALAHFTIEGPKTRALLAKGCSLDVHVSRFPPGRAARTRFAGLPVIVRCTDVSSFEFIVTASYTEFLISWLNDASVEFEGHTV